MIPSCVYVRTSARFSTAKLAELALRPANGIEDIKTKGSKWQPVDSTVVRVTDVTARNRFLPVQQSA